MEDGHIVVLNVYDLSKGMARQFSSTLLGKVIEGIWHTGVVVYDQEYYFGDGIQQAAPGSSPYGTPLKVENLGVTHVPQDLFELYLQQIKSRYTPETYNLRTHNCNNFTNEVANFLVHASIPDYILQLPKEVENSPMGSLIMPMIQSLEMTLKAGGVPQAPQFRPSSIVTQPPPVAEPPQFVRVTEGHEEIGLSNEVKFDDSKLEAIVGENVVLPAMKLNKAKEKPVAGCDSPGDSKNKLHREILCEFTQIMETGSQRASEAAATATRKVMERHGIASSKPPPA